MTTLDLKSLMFVGTEMLFFVLLLLYIIHGFILSYHWFTYGSNKEISLIALSVYLAGGAVLFLTLSLGLNTL
jgi:hypothetical protein